MFTNVEWAEIPSNEVQGLGCTFGYIVHMVIPRQFAANIQAEVFSSVNRYHWFGFLIVMICGSGRGNIMDIDNSWKQGLSTIVNALATVT